MRVAIQNSEYTPTHTNRQTLQKNEGGGREGKERVAFTTCSVFVVTRLTFRFSLAVMLASHRVGLPLPEKDEKTRKTLLRRKKNVTGSEDKQKRRHD